MTDWIPWQLRESLRRTLDLPERFSAMRRFRRIRRADASSVRLGFGGVLNDGRAIHGGAVKLLPLRAAFGGDDEVSNIVYAVSSSPPRFAEDFFEVCRGKRIRIVWNQNGVGYPAWAGGESERFNSPMRKLRDQADFVVYQSQFCRVSAEKFLGPCEKPYLILYNPVDCGLFAPGVRATPGVLRLLAAGTHGTRDRVIPLLDALTQLRSGGIDAMLTVAGGFRWKNAEPDFWREVVGRRLDAVVRRVRNFSQIDAPELYRGHDVLLHPKYMDPCPTVVLEALACGLPVVGSRSGGMAEIVPGSCGVLVACEEDWGVRHSVSALDLAAAVSEIVPRLEEMSTAARRHAVETFPVDRWVDEHAQIFRGLLE